MSLNIQVDSIAYPKDLSQTSNSKPLWSEMLSLESKIKKAACLFKHSDKQILVADSKTKKGSEARGAAKEVFKIAQGNLFIGAYAHAKKEIPVRIKEISELQASQKELLKKMRASNSAYLSMKKSEKAEVAKNNAEAFASGNFWEADRDAIKNYFHPPFDKNYLADVSEKWRAALFLECKSESYKRASGSWGHKLVGTNRGYLCGIDDNGDEWGHVVVDLGQDHDDFGCNVLDNTVSDAMAVLFNAPASKIDKALRQGDLLFMPVKIRNKEIIRCEFCHKPKDQHDEISYDYGIKISYCPNTYCRREYSEETLPAIELEPQEGEWQIRESHTVQSEGLLRNGRYFKSANPIIVTHTSHQPVILEPGEYRLYTLDIANAD